MFFKKTKYVILDVKSNDCCKYYAFILQTGVYLPIIYVL